MENEELKTVHTLNVKTLLHDVFKRRYKVQVFLFLKFYLLNKEFSNIIVVYSITLCLLHKVKVK